jgi:hypothetical protein
MDKVQLRAGKLAADTILLIYRAVEQPAPCSGRISLRCWQRFQMAVVGGLQARPARPRCPGCRRDARGTGQAEDCRHRTPAREGGPDIAGRQDDTHDVGGRREDGARPADRTDAGRLGASQGPRPDTRPTDHNHRGDPSAQAAAFVDGQLLICDRIAQALLWIHALSSPQERANQHYHQPSIATSNASYRPS